MCTNSVCKAIQAALPICVHVHVYMYTGWLIKTEPEKFLKAKDFTNGFKKKQDRIRILRLKIFKSLLLKHKVFF